MENLGHVSAFLGGISRSSSVKSFCMDKSWVILNENSKCWIEEVGLSVYNFQHVWCKRQKSSAVLSVSGDNVHSVIFFFEGFKLGEKVRPEVCSGLSRIQQVGGNQGSPTEVRKAFFSHPLPKLESFLSLVSLMCSIIESSTLKVQAIFVFLNEVARKKRGNYANFQNLVLIRASPVPYFS